MASSSDDDKVLRDRERLDQLRQKEQSLDQELQRCRKEIQIIEEKLKRKDSVSLRPNHARREGKHFFSERLTMQPQHPNTSLTKSVKHQTFPLPNPFPINAKPPRAPLPLPNDDDDDYTCATAGLSDDDSISDRVSSVTVMDTFSVFGSRRGHKAKQSSNSGLDSVSRTTSAMKNTIQPFSIPMSAIPSTTKNAKQMRDHIYRVRGFIHLIRILSPPSRLSAVIQRNSIAIEMIDWPVTMTPGQMIQRLKEMCRVHLPDCPIRPTPQCGRVSSDTSVTACNSTTCVACNATTLVQNDFSSFLYLAFLNGCSLDDLYACWDINERNDWIRRYVKQENQTEVRAAANLFIQILESERKKLGVSSST
ncbi:hypothetical protein CPB86DRAFT_788379 [Serendipita vermifera]|nr:hypothetical protein CPB86DRAFT_788379 [Serendipita vermifera]